MEKWLIEELYASGDCRHRMRIPLAKAIMCGIECQILKDCNKENCTLKITHKGDE